MSHVPALAFLLDICVVSFFRVHSVFDLVSGIIAVTVFTLNFVHHFTCFSFIVYDCIVYLLALSTVSCNR